MFQAYAAKTCKERGLNSGCLPGQHVKTDGNTDHDVVGNPHYPQIGVDRTGDPQDSTFCNSDNGNTMTHLSAKRMSLRPQHTCYSNIAI
jgi:hypothetical protein